MEPTPQKPDGVNVFGGSGALKFERIVNKHGQYVLSIDAALVKQGSMTSSGFKYDWDNKINFQILPKEHPAFVCCLLGLVPSFEAGMHGQHRDKKLTVVNQPEKGVLFIKLQQKEILVPVPVLPDCVFLLSSLSTKILAEQCFSDQATALTLLRATAGRLLFSKAK